MGSDARVSSTRRPVSRPPAGAELTSLPGICCAQQPPASTRLLSSFCMWSEQPSLGCQLPARHLEPQEPFLCPAPPPRREAVLGNTGAGGHPVLPGAAPHDPGRITSAGTPGSQLGRQGPKGHAANPTPAQALGVLGHPSGTPHRWPTGTQVVPGAPGQRASGSALEAPAPPQAQPRPGRQSRGRGLQDPWPSPAPRPAAHHLSLTPDPPGPSPGRARQLGFRAPLARGSVSVKVAPPVTVTRQRDPEDRVCRTRPGRTPGAACPHTAPRWPGGLPAASSLHWCTHLPGLQLEPQAQLGVVDGGVVLQLCQGQLEVRQGLLEPAGSREPGMGTLGGHRERGRASSQPHLLGGGPPWSQHMGSIPRRAVQGVGLAPPPAAWTLSQASVCTEPWASPWASLLEAPRPPLDSPSPRKPPGSMRREAAPTACLPRVGPTVGLAWGPAVQP